MELGHQLLNIRARTTRGQSERPLKRRRAWSDDGTPPPAKRVLLQAPRVLRAPRGASRGLRNPASAGALAPGRAVELLLDTHYLASDEQLSSVAADLLAQLHEHPQRDNPLWSEAMATALMALGRHNDAGRHYAQLAACAAFPQRAVLTAARFSWPFQMPLSPDAPRELLEQSLLGAAASGNLLAVQDLEAAGVSLGAARQGVTAARVAAHYGRTNVLTYLETR